MKKALLFLFILSSFSAGAQKRSLDHQDFDTWKTIANRQISNDGKFILYELAPGKGDHSLNIKKHSGGEVAAFDRGQSGRFTADSEYAVLTIKPASELINQLRRIKTRKEEMPRDSLAIIQLENGETTLVPNIRGYSVPEKWSGYVFYQLDNPVPVKIEKDSADVGNEKNKVKKMSEDNGFHLVIYNLETAMSDTIKYVTDYRLAKEEPRIIYHTSGVDSTIAAGVYLTDVKSGDNIPLTRHTKGKFRSLTLDNSGSHAAFLADLDSTKALKRNFELRFWKEEYDSAFVKADSATSAIPDDWVVSEHGRLIFSDDSERLFFGIAPRPLIQDTTLLEEEIVQVEIWNYQNGRLHTQQNVELEEDKKKSYLAHYEIDTDRIVQLGDSTVTDVRLNEKLTSQYALGVDYSPYDKFISWEGYPRRQDVYTVDIRTGERRLVRKDLRGTAQLSATGKYVYWYDANDTTWFVYNNETSEEHKISIEYSFADELNDQPNYPSSYGSAGWTENDEYLLLYDRYDIWQFDPVSNSVVNLTNGRADRVRHRYIDLDREEEAIEAEFMLLSLFNEATKESGFASLKNLKTKKELVFGPYAYGGVMKAKDSDNLVYTRESNEVFPDLLASDLSFNKTVQISNANPEISSYYWSTVELISWVSLDGEKLEGLLYKPEGFDPEKKYPMITYFYERNSDNLHRHWGAELHRSIVNPAFYASRGYVVFIPDIVYTTGYPGESCYNAVIPGVTSLIEQGFIDENRLGVQGHSWGGYQVAYLVTQTNIFTAAEAGAVVSNMISAYGGIRWGSGLSRMFQYEHTQSRIGGTLWQYPLRYIENSPIFYVDKINTPLLLLHNDEDGAVPWYQGIEFFTALRRLNKPAWMLNYNGEPHWPTKWENKRDFKVRMQQFFDHYLMDAPLPVWMSADGIPALEKGINKGYELMTK